MKKVLKRLLVASAIALFVCLSPVFGQAASDEEMWGRFVGEWLNPDYGYSDWAATMTTTRHFRQRRILEPAFVGKDWRNADDAEPEAEYIIQPREFWIDESGAVNCLLWWEDTSSRTVGGYQAHASPALFRISKTGDTLECYYQLAARQGSPRNMVEIGFKTLKANPERVAESTGLYLVYRRAPVQTTPEL